MIQKGGGVAILGAGPAGLAAAFELDRAGRDFIVIEKAGCVGGLSRTLKFGQFLTDIGPHRFFSKNEYLYGMIGQILGERWIPVNRLTRFYIDGKFFTYPVELKNALLNVGPYKAFRIVSDYLFQRARKVFVDKSPASFEEQIVSDFGRTLAELNMLNYTEKIWGLDCTQISPDWSKQRIKGLSFFEVVKNAVMKSNSGAKTLVDRFYYPDTGAGLLYERMREEISKKRDAVRLNSQPTRIMHDGARITKVVVDAGGNEKVLSPENIISSIPVTEFVELLEPKAPKDVLEAAKKLRFRSHVSLFITLGKRSVFPDQWVYFPTKEIPFGRIMEPRNFSKKMSPKGKTSLLIEFFCWEGDDIWNAGKGKLVELSAEWLERLGFIKKSDIIGSFVHREKYAYPVYDLAYKRNSGKVMGYLAQFKNLECIGRSGTFRYNNQDHALEMGILAARSLIEGKKYDIDDVGSEQEYFEKGYVNG